MMVDRVAVPDAWSGAGINIDPTSLSNIVIAQRNNMFCGVMHLGRKRIYLAALHGYAPDELDAKGKPLNGYGTINPAYPSEFPQRIPKSAVPSTAGVFRQLVEGRTIAPIKHKDPSNPKEITSHEQFVIAIGGVGKNYCGFALRFEAASKPGRKICVKLSPTSRTLNPNSNGRLEDCILDAVYRYLTPKLALLGMTLTKVDAGTNPDKSAKARLIKANKTITKAQLDQVDKQQKKMGGMLASIGPSTCDKCNKTFSNAFGLRKHAKTCK